MTAAERTTVQAKLSRGADGWEIHYGATDTLIIPAPLAEAWAHRILTEGRPATASTAALAVDASGRKAS